MHGPRILARSLTQPGVVSKASGNLWQYNSRSDRHSKIACWGVLFDLLLESELLRRHFDEGTLVFGVNHEMRDFKMDRKKDLDLVVCTPADKGDHEGRNFAELVDKYGVVLNSTEQRLLEDLPTVREARVGGVRMALEAKACMTEHVKAIPRLHDELNSSHLTIHGAANHAIAIGFAMINVADTFVSSERNKFDLSKYPAQVTKHDQPRVAQRVVEMLRKLARRTKTVEEGFEALGIAVVDCPNDGRPVELVLDPPAPQAGDIFEYEAMIRRAGDLYEARFKMS